jgi:prevent-host-death family protein
MRISVTEAKGQLTELVRLAEAGDEVILTRHGHATVRLVPVNEKTDSKSRRALLDELRESARSKATPGPNAARSQDFLYNDHGLPE